MEFQLNDEQQAFSDLARQILEEGATHERMREIGDRLLLFGEGEIHA